MSKVKVIFSDGSTVTLSAKSVNDAWKQAQALCTEDKIILGFEDV